MDINKVVALVKEGSECTVTQRNIDDGLKLSFTIEASMTVHISKGELDSCNMSEIQVAAMLLNKSDAKLMAYFKTKIEGDD